MHLEQDIAQDIERKAGGVPGVAVFASFARGISSDVHYGVLKRYLCRLGCLQANFSCLGQFHVAL